MTIGHRRQFLSLKYYWIAETRHESGSLKLDIRNEGGSVVKLDLNRLHIELKRLLMDLKMSHLYLKRPLLLIEKYIDRK